MRFTIMISSHQFVNGVQNVFGFRNVSVSTVPDMFGSFVSVGCAQVVITVVVVSINYYMLRLVYF